MKKSVFFLLLLLCTNIFSLTQDGNWLRMDDGTATGDLKQARLAGDYLWMLDDYGFGRLHLPTKDWFYFRFEELNFSSDINHFFALDSNNIVLTSDEKLLIYNGIEFKKVDSPLSVIQNILMTKDGKIWIFRWGRLFCLENDEWKFYRVDSLRIAFEMTEGDSGEILYHDIISLWSFNGSARTLICKDEKNYLSKHVKRDPANGNIWIFGMRTILVTPNFTHVFYNDSTGDFINYTTTIDDKGYIWVERHSDRLRYWVRARPKIDYSGSGENYFEYLDFKEKKLFDFSFKTVITEKGIIEISSSGIYIPDSSGNWNYISYHQLFDNKPGRYSDVDELILSRDSSILISVYPGYVARYKDGTCYTSETLHSIDNIIERKNGNLTALSWSGIYKLNNTTWEQVSSICGQDLHEDPDGKLWLRSHDGSCIYHEINDSTWETVNSSNSNIPDNIQKMIISENGTVWVMNHGVIAKSIDGYEWECKTCKDLSVPDSGILRMFPGQNNKMVILSKHNEYKKISLYDGSWLDSVGIDTNTNKFEEPRIYQDSRNNFWVSSSKKIDVFGNDGNFTLTHKNCPVVEPDACFASFLEDYEGNIWISGSQGITIYNIDNFSSFVRKAGKPKPDFRIELRPYSNTFSANFVLHDAECISLSVYNLHGMLVHKTGGFFQKGSHRIPVMFNAATGEYIVNISNSKSRWISKYIIK